MQNKILNRTFGHALFVLYLPLCLFRQYQTNVDISTFLDIRLHNLFINVDIITNYRFRKRYIFVSLEYHLLTLIYKGLRDIFVS